MTQSLVWYLCAKWHDKITNQRENKSDWSTITHITDPNRQHSIFWWCFVVCAHQSTSFLTLLSLQTENAHQGVCDKLGPN